MHLTICIHKLGLCALTSSQHVLSFWWFALKINQKYLCIKKKGCWQILVADISY